MLRSFLHRRTHFAPVALRSDNCGKSDGMRLGCSCGCALTDTLLWNGWLARLLRSFASGFCACFACQRWGGRGLRCYF